MELEAIGNQRTMIIHAGGGDVTNAYDGRTAWKASSSLYEPVPVVPLVGSDLDAAAVEAALTFPAKIKQTLTDWKVGFPFIIDNNDVETVQGTSAGKLPVKLYFDSKSGLLVRMVRYWDGELLHTYITNVLDPHQLSLKEIAQLYGRRWDIELAFLLLKEYLGLHHWWSSQSELIKQQCLGVLIVAQVVQKMRMQMAIQAGVDAFEVSLPLLMQVLPELLQERQEPLEWMKTYGKELKIIRASNRLEPKVVQVREEEIVMPEGELYQERKARYHSYGEEEEKKRENTKKRKKGKKKKRKKKKKERKKKRGGEGGGKKKSERGKRKEEKKEEKNGEKGVRKESRKREKVQKEGGGEEDALKQEEVRGEKLSGEEGKEPILEKKGEEGENKEVKRKKRTEQRKEALFVQEGLPNFSG